MEIILSSLKSWHRLIIIHLAVIGLVLATFSPGLAKNDVVKIYNWSDYIDDSIIDQFTKETGIKVIYDVFDSNEIAETKLLAGGSGFDIVVPSAEFLARQIQAGVFQKLDKNKIPNLKTQWDFILRKTADFDPGNNYSVNYLWGTTGIGYNVAMINERMADAPINSWDILFKPEVIAKFADCGVYVLDAPAEMIRASLNYLGFDPNTTKIDELKKAGELLGEIRPYIQKFHSSEYINALANGDICLAVGWSGDILQARDRAIEAKNSVDVAYSIPDEGAQMWFDQMAIPKDAVNVEAAHKFMDFILRPEISARITDYVHYASGNLAAQKYIDKNILDDKGIYPSKETLEKLYTTTPYKPRVQRQVTRIWTKVKTNQ